MRIALDFDGTVIVRGTYPDIGEELHGCIDTLLRIQELGARIFLWTCRGGRELDAAELWLEARGINLHQPEYLQGAAKPVADLYIDDRGLGIPLTVYGVDWKAISPRLIAAMEMAQRAETGCASSQEADSPRPRQGDGDS